MNNKEIVENNVKYPYGKGFEVIDIMCRDGVKRKGIYWNGVLQGATKAEHVLGWIHHFKIVYKINN